MIKGLYHSSRTLEVQSKSIESVANNLANVNTTGYKRQLPFSEVLSESGEVKIKQYTDFGQAQLVSTNNPFDLAILGEGYFALKTENGTEYTRNGKFKISSEGYLVNEQGYNVLGASGEINIQEFSTQDNQDVKISSTGEIKIGKDVVDSIMIVKIEDEQNTARQTGLNLTADSSNVSLLDTNKFEIHQGYLEESNVNPIFEMESMMRMNHDFESAQKMMRYLDQSLGHANEIGKV